MNNQDYLFNDIFEKETTFTAQMREYEYNKKVGNNRLSKGQYYTDTEKEKYKKESLERHLP